MSLFMFFFSVAAAFYCFHVACKQKRSVVFMAACGGANIANAIYLLMLVVAGR